MGTIFAAVQPRTCVFSRGNACISSGERVISLKTPEYHKLLHVLSAHNLYNTQRVNTPGQLCRVHQATAVCESTNLKLEDASIFTTTAVTSSLEQVGTTSMAKISSISLNSETSRVSHRVSRKPAMSVRSRMICQIT